MEVRVFSWAPQIVIFQLFKKPCRKNIVSLTNHTDIEPNNDAYRLSAATLLAAEGVSVLFAARTSSEIEQVAHGIRCHGGTAQTIACDVSCYPRVVAMVSKCKRDFGRMGILVNNAGPINPISRLADADPDGWAKVADVNY